MPMIERTFASWDGAELFYRAWLPAEGRQAGDKSLLLFHRGHEHSGRWTETVESLDLRDFAIFAWDQRGHGRSPGERGAAESLAAVIKDAEYFARHIAAEHGYPIAQMSVLAHSVGAVIASAWVHDYAPPIRAMVLGSPAFGVKLYVPFAVPALRLKRRFLGGSGGAVQSYVKAGVLTHDFTEQQGYRSDPLIFRQIAVNILLDLHDTSSRLLADAGAIDVPTLILSAEKDWVVELGAQRKFFRGISSPIKRLEVLPGSYHAIFHEKDRQLAVKKVRDFLLEIYAQPPHQGPCLIHADRGGYTRTEYDLLRTPGSARWMLVRAYLKSMGNLSRGIRIGNQSGFDSGVMLDYIYENRPGGFTPLGRMIDRIYLNAIGWRGIRVRRENLERILRQAMAGLHAAGRPVRVLDIAAGPGRYVLGVMRETPAIPASALLRDYQQANLDAAKKLADEFGVRDVQILRGDAFDRASLAATSPRPTIAIVSGLYELFPGNEPVLNSLRGVADALEPGGVLIYTNQPWHPQVEFIARSLNNREGEPWIMRRRTQAEMDALAAAAGFEKVSQEIDPWGIFTVSLARRSESAPS
jgi:alpha-beta hydrolase superfamily lysophospholipase/SAM-dependent methyltransferase